MVLQELEIQGFKSFPDRTKIKIGPGITAVVGPNGSGKSNISDAIRWVLGETSSKQLRGAGKMEDVIFGGTQTRGAMGYAMVNLTMDNLDRRIDVDADQVTIGRRYYRSGESEYTINGQNVRLKDIYELFLDTGVGRDGYSIISQGRIAEIVGAKSNERREIFEEASGIARYRYRKNEAERRLAGAEDNLVRLRDILAELESRVGPLEKESQKAQQFLELSARRKEREITLWVDNIRRSRETVREQQRRFETAQADYDRLTAELESIDAETEEIRRRVQQYTVEIERRNADIRAITEEMAGSDSRIAVLNNDIAHNETTIASLRGEIEQGQAGKEAIAAQIAEKQAACEEAAARCAQLDEAIARLEERLRQIQEGSQATGERRGQLTAQLAELTDRQTGLRVQAASAAGAGEQARERQTAAAAELETARAQREALRTEQADTEAYLAQVCETVTRLENIKGGLQMKLDSRRRQLEQADAAEQSLQRQAEAAQQRLQVLRDLERNWARCSRWNRGMRWPSRPPWALPCRTSWWKGKPPPKRPSPFCGIPNPAAPPSCRWIRCRAAGSPARCPPGPGWPPTWCRPTPATPPWWITCLAASSWWKTSTRPAAWPGNCATATGWSRWTARWSTRAVPSPAAACPAPRACSAASRRSTN